MTRYLRYVAFFGLASVIVACGASPRRGGGGTEPQYSGYTGPTPTGQTAPPPSAVSGSPREQLEQVDGYLRSQGLAPMGPAVANRGFATGAVIAYGIDSTPGACYTIVAIADAGSDLNLTVMDPQGRTIAYNVDPDPNPWATVCPGITGRVVVRLQMASGTSDYLYSVYRGGPAARPQMAALFGAAAEQVQSAQLDPNTQQRLTALDQQMQGRGFQRIAEPHGEVFANRQDRNFALNLQAGYCYAFASLGGPGARDTDVFLIDGSGDELERDVSTNMDATVQYCPEQTGQYALRARMYSGEGPLFTVGYIQSRGGQQVQTANVIANQSTAGAGLEENVRLLDSDMRARGYEPYGQPARGQLTQGQEQDFSIQLEGGKCYALLGVGDNGVRDLDLVLSSGSRQIDRDVEADPRPIVRVCAPSSGTYSLKVRMFSGQGNFVYSAYRWPRGTRGPFGLSGLIYVRLAEVSSLLRVEGYQPDTDAAPGQGRLARQGASGQHNIQLQGGQCYSILVVGGDGIADLDATLSGGGSQVATDGSRNAFPAVRHCPSSTGRFSLSVNAANGAGQYFYQVFKRPTGG